MTLLAIERIEGLVFVRVTVLGLYPRGVTRVRFEEAIRSIAAGEIRYARRAALVSPPASGSLH